MFKLVIADDEGKQTVVPLVRDEVTIGRKEGNTIRLTERNVSRRHARLVKSNGKFVIEDLQSYNGVKVNGSRISGEAPLDAGDQITIGDYQLALQTEAADATAPSAAPPAVTSADTAMIAAPGPPARLVMITPPAPGAEFALTADRTRIGRAEDLDIWVNHRSISREHAEIQKEPDGLRLIDLGSANGVRVNGNDVQNALLEAGDVVELGQVRFRFVAAGEHYAFDADRTVQMDAVSLETPTSNRVPLLVAVAIVVLALIGALAVAFVGSGEPDDTTEATPLGTNPAGSSDERYQAALDACQAAIANGDGEEATRQARAALEVRPGDEAASACQARAQAAQSHEETFQRGVAHLDRGELEDAYFQFDSLPEESPLRERDEVRQAVRSYAGLKLAAGRTALNDDPSEALRLAEFVLNMHGLTDEQRVEATQLQRDARARGATETEPSEPVASGGDSRGGRRSGGGRRSSGRTGGGGSGPATAPAPAPSPAPAPAPVARPAADNGQEARQCVLNGDNACVIRLLEGRARNAQELGYLIEAYRARSQMSQALRHMRTYVQRYPGTPRANQYRQILARQR